MGGDGPLERRRILIVDDDSTVGSVIRRVLRDHDVTLVTSATEAIAMLETGAGFDLILCDMNMPELDGADFYRRVAESWPEQAARVVFLTGDTDQLTIRPLLASVPHLSKPFEIAELRALVAARLSRCA
jgi:CheY-like chemotaxis protein